MPEVKISGAYIQRGNLQDKKVFVKDQDLVTTASDNNSVLIKMCPGKQDQITLLGHRISIKDIGVVFDGETQFYKLKWYERTNLPYLDKMRENVWCELYEMQIDTPVFEKLAEPGALKADGTLQVSTIEDFPLSTPGLSRKLEFAIFAETSNHTGFFLQAVEVNKGSTSAFVINHCGTVAGGSFNDLKTYLGSELEYSDSDFALPAGINIQPIVPKCSVEKVYIRGK